MTKLKIVIAAGLATGVLALSTISPALAWEPKGIIVKKVQDQTTNSALVDADSAKDALSVNKGDILKYVITVSNVGTPSENGHNDMANTKITDTLPAGVELVSDPTQRTITADLGLIKPGKSVTKEYLVRVTSTTNGAIVENKACFTGNSTVNDNPQHDCNLAVVKVIVPVQEPPVTPPKVLGVQTPPKLPATGPEQLIASAAGLSAVGYGASAYIRSKRNLAASHKR